MKNVGVPVIVSGGMGKLVHLNSLIAAVQPSAISVAHVLHYNELKIADIKSHLAQLNVDVRQ